MPRINVVIAGDASKLNKAMSASERRMRKFASGLKTVGDGIFTAVGVPFIAAGAAGVKAAVDFESSIAKIKGLVGVAGKDLKELETAALTLGPKYGKSAGEAADALFFITSAGLRGKEAIDVLEMSLKAAAAGLGETKQVADLVTSAMNAYGPANLSAAQATDTLVAAIREGKLEPETLAGAMSQVLPAAQAMGVKFNEVGAALAAMSRTGTPAAEAATQLKGILATLMKPTQEGAEALEQMGLSGEMLRKKLKDEGLMSVLLLLQEKFDGNIESTSEVIGNIRALTGYLDMMSNEGETTVQIFERMTNVAGDANKAYEAAAKTTKQQLAVALSQLNAAGIELGQQLIPVVTKVVDGISKMVAWFRQLSDSTKQSIVNWGLLITGFGASLSIAGRVIQSIAATSAALRALGLTSMITSKAFKTMWSRFLLPVAAVVAALEGLEYLFNKLTPAQKAMTGPLNGLMGGYHKLKDALGFVNDKGEENIDVCDDLSSEYDGITTEVKDMTSALNTGAASFDNLGDKMSDAEKKAAMVKARMQPLIKQIQTFNEHLEKKPAAPRITQVTSNTQTSGPIGGDISGLIPTISNQMQTMGADVAVITESINGNINSISDAFWGLTESQRAAAGVMMSTANAIGGALGEMAVSGTLSLKKLAAAALAAAASFMRAKLIEALSATIANAFTKYGIVGAAVAAVGSGLVVGAFDAIVSKATSAASKVPALREGGMTTSAGYAMIGDNPSGKEFVIPYEKMGDFARRAMGGSNVNVSGEFRVKGTDLVLVLERQNRLTTAKRGYGING